MLCYSVIPSINELQVFLSKKKEEEVASEIHCLFIKR